MNKLSSKRKHIVVPNDFTFKKSLGQNFLTDVSVCERMVEDIDKETCVLEIGPGAGVLTKRLCAVAKQVVAIEIDTRLKPILEKEFENTDNVTFVFADVLKTDLFSLIKECFGEKARVVICANLPYYITSPIIMDILNRRLPVEELTVMVQKEAAERLCAEVGSRAAGAVTAAVRYYSEPEILFKVPRTSFTPAPNVDSAVIRLKILKTAPVTVLSEDYFMRFVKACFAQRRKTLLNTVSNTLGVDKNTLRCVLGELNLNESVRGETLSLEQLAALSDMLYLLENK